MHAKDVKEWSSLPSCPFSEAPSEIRVIFFASFDAIAR
jgi:hypothetical protein